MQSVKKKCFVSLISAMMVACAASEPPKLTPMQVIPAIIKGAAIPVVEEEIAGSAISLEQIMADPDWLGRQTSSPYWADNSQGVFYTRKRQGSPLNDLWAKDIAGGPKGDNGQKVSLATLHQHSYKNRVLNGAGNQAAWVFQGNLFFKDLTTDKILQLSRDEDQPSKLQFLLDGRLSFQIHNSVYALDIATGFRQKLVSWVFADAPVAAEEPADYLQEQQIALLSVVAKKRQDKKAHFEHQQSLHALNDSLTPKPFYLPKEHETVQASLAPDGQRLLLVEQETQPSREDGDIMPNYIADDGRIKAEEVRQRVADAKPQDHSLWLLDLAKGSQHKLSYKTLPGFNDDVLALVKKENAEAKGQRYQTNRLPRDIVLMQDWYWSQSAIQWHRSGQQVAVMLEAWDNKDRWITTVDFQDNNLISQHRLHDDAWINYKMNSFGWMNKGESLYYLSEESGYAHLYHKPIDAKAKALTAGRYEVDALTLTSDDQFIYFKANKKHPGIYDVYRVNTVDGEIEALSDLNGMTDYQLSPDERHLLLTHSKLTMPPELYVQGINTDAQPRRLSHTVSEAFLALPWIRPDIVAVESSNTQAPIYSRVYTPKPSVNGDLHRAVIFNHGAGYLQNSHLGWSGYFREFMFHNMLAQQGYVVMDMDYRASAGYGRDWRTAIYRHMGKVELEDLRDGVDWMVENANVDRLRIGTYGGSYGGFLTFMALFNAPDLFQAGAALRPVSDWAHYNHGYTSNILNTPDIDPIAYERSSPIYFAEGLEKSLLINAPMVDSNVFFVDTVRLVQRLIELEKQNFETAIYPVESHGFVQPSSWLDEYRRIYKLFDTNL
ncbi:MAG: dipeptidyl aminopeptidase/acylaminoacyl peptidase [Paraglaciecola sp.]|jgi:dipeptidyl aminopeptidase/acylaminoacyl peptidase